MDDSQNGSGAGTVAAVLGALALGVGTAVAISSSKRPKQQIAGGLGGAPRRALKPIKPVYTPPKIKPCNCGR